MPMRFVGLALGVVAILILLGVAASSTRDRAGKTRFVVGSMVWNTTIPFYSNLIKGEEEAAKKYGVTLLVRNGQGNIAGEVAVIQQFISQKVDLILVSPSDSRGIAPVLKQANAADIPVIAVNSTVADDVQLVTYVGADDHEFGRQQGALLVKAIGTSGKVALILGHLGVSAQILREQGLMDVVKEYPNIEIVSKQSADWDYAQALRITQDLLTKYPPGTLDAIVSQGPEGVVGAGEAAETKRSDVTFIAGDYPADVREAIRAGTVYGTVHQDPYLQGFRGVELAFFALSGQRGKVPSATEFIPLPFITSDNVAEVAPAW